MECSWASLNTNAGIQNLTIPANNNLDSTWEIFETNDTSVFGTALNTDTNTQRNIKFDNVLKIKKSGVCIMGFKARWASGNYVRRNIMLVTQEYLNHPPASMVTPMQKWSTTDHEVNEDYKTMRAVNTGDFVRFTLYNDDSVSRVVNWRTAYVLWFPTVSPGASIIF